MMSNSSVFVLGLVKLSREVNQETALLLDTTNTIATAGQKYFVVLDVIPLAITVSLSGKQGVFGVYNPETLKDLQNAVVHVCIIFFFFLVSLSLSRLKICNSGNN